MTFMAKYKEQVADMLEANDTMFRSFKELHDKYEEDPKKWQEDFNIEGQKVMRVIQKWENMLCGKSESGKYGVFSSKLSEKFWNEVRIHFPKIDFVGMKIN